MMRVRSWIRLLGALAMVHALSAAAAPADTPSSMRVWDDRRDLPLLPMMAEHQKQSMRGHLQAVSDIVAALAVDDFGTIEKAASRLGYSDEMGRMCENFGRAAPEFTVQALAFHHTADRVIAAAHDRDRARVVNTLSDTLIACTNCHASWKQRVVDEATWNRLTAPAAAASPGHD